MNLLKRDFIIREPLLVAILVVITVLFSTLTHSYTQAYDRRRTALGTQWFARGNQELKNNRPAAAVEDFRTALLYAPQNWEYRMHLAQALTAANQTKQAMDYYLSLWQSNPRNGQVNLQLARLAVRNGEVEEAERYFNGAIFGDWPEGSSGSRLEASLELISFYLDRGDSGHAETQLMILSENLPEDPAMHARVGDLYSRVGDEQRGLKQYQWALQFDPNYFPAVLGAGQAAFRVGHYRAAEGYLGHALRLDQSNATARELQAITQSVLLLNPYEHGIATAEKVRRALRGFAIIGNQLQSCVKTPGTPGDSAIEPFLEKWNQLKAMANSRFLTQHPDEVDTLFDFYVAAEKQAETSCGQPGPEVSALLAIARTRETGAK